MIKKTNFMRVIWDTIDDSKVLKGFGFKNDERDIDRKLYGGDDSEVELMSDKEFDDWEYASSKIYDSETSIDKFLRRVDFITEEDLDEDLGNYVLEYVYQLLVIYGMHKGSAHYETYIGGSRTPKLVNDLFVNLISEFGDEDYYE